jgi:hypothetical protein
MNKESWLIFISILIPLYILFGLALKQSKKLELFFRAIYINILKPKEATYNAQNRSNGHYPERPMQTSNDNRPNDNPYKKNNTSCFSQLFYKHIIGDSKIENNHKRT